MFNRQNNLFKDNRGQAVAEAALIIPVLLLLLFGIFTVGYWFNAQLVVSAAAREGARVGALTGDREQIGDTVMNTLKIIDTNVNRISIEVPNSLPPIKKDLTVRVIYQVPLLFGYFKSEYEKVATSTPFPFSQAIGQAVARMEVDPVK